MDPRPPPHLLGAARGGEVLVTAIAVTRYTAALWFLSTIQAPGL
jgi:hypothetical protein